jgi:hypothetical protein
MDIKGYGVVVSVNPVEQSDEWLLSASQEIADVARERGLELPAFAGTVAVEAAQETKTLDPSDVKESITNQFNVAYDAYATVVDNLNGVRKKREHVTPADQIKANRELDEWFSDEKLDYVARAMEADPDLRFTLVATPNVLVSKDELVAVAKEFGKKQPYETYVWDPLYEKYTPEQLSGTDPTNHDSVMFSLIPNKTDEDLYGTVEQQKEKFARLQRANPNLKVPSVLESVAYWQTLRATDPDLLKSGAFDRTYIRHFDLPEQRLDRWLGVPASYVGAGGRPGLGVSDAGNGYRGRVAVG